MRILITGAGGPAAISVWKSLNAEHELYMADIDPCAAGLYLVPAARRALVPRGDSLKFVETIFSLCKKHNIEVLLATVDSELVPLAKAATQFAAANISVPLSPLSTLQQCYDKYYFLNACQGVIPTPEFILLNKDNFSSVNDFPRFVKPRVGAGSHGAMILATAKELANLPLDNSLLVQELLPGDEYSVDTYIDSKGYAIAAVPRLRMKVDSGVAVTACTRHFPELTKLAVKIALHLGIRFMANIQFKQAHDGQFKILEINPRFSGALPLTTAAGVDIPKLLLNDLQNKDLPSELMPFAELMVVRYWTEHFFPIKEWDNVCKS